MVLDLTGNPNILQYENVHFDYQIIIRMLKAHDVAPSFILPHYHEAIEIIYLTQGELKIIDDAQQSVLKSGEFHIFNSNSVHSTRFSGIILTGVVV